VRWNSFVLVLSWDTVVGRGGLNGESDDGVPGLGVAAGFVFPIDVDLELRSASALERIVCEDAIYTSAFVSVAVVRGVVALVRVGPDFKCGVEVCDLAQ
jgi:hypothetical protein